jgi:hypothetical protein
MSFHDRATSGTQGGKMEEYAIHDVTVQDVTGINGAFQPIVTKHVTFYVGGNGPFFLDYSPTQFEAGAVLADMQKQADMLRAIGAKPTLRTGAA